MHTPWAALAETHVSVVFFVGDRAYKLKKPVTTGFLDFSTREARARVCHREVELNRRLAPDVYLGVADVLDPEGRPLDHLVVMRRMPEDRRLSTLARRGEVTDEHLTALARLVAAFHARAESSPEIAAAGSADAVRASWTANHDEMEPFVGRVLDPDRFERVELLAREYLAGRGPLLAHRAAAGMVRDGHGDLLADDVFLLDDGPRVLDCIEFDDRLRWADVVADVAFLVMDLERIGAPELGQRFVARYREMSAERHPATLAEHYVAYRAQVRCKVACLRWDQGVPAAADEARRLLEMCVAHLEAGRVPLVLVGGLPGTGKTTLAAGIADARGWSLLRSDEVRKDLAGVGHLEHRRAGFREGLYAPEATEATYTELLDRARRLLEMGEPVVLDASWTDRRWRDAAAGVAREASSPLVELRCDAPADVAAARIAARGATDASDATTDVAGAMARVADAWPTARTIETSGSPGAALRTALALLAEEDTEPTLAGGRRTHGRVHHDGPAGAAR